MYSMTLDQQYRTALNSSMVLFILSRPSRVSPSLATLNSSMVLFILIGANKKEDGYYIFKFQYGAIYIGGFFYEPK